MARNIEIKAHIESVEALAPKAFALTSEGPIEIVQDDTFFRCESGRLLSYIGMRLQASVSVNSRSSVFFED